MTIGRGSAGGQCKRILDTYKHMAVQERTRPLQNPMRARGIDIVRSSDLGYKYPGLNTVPRICSWGMAVRNHPSMSLGSDSCKQEDTVEYKLPLGNLEDHIRN